MTRAPVVARAAFALVAAVVTVATASCGAPLMKRMALPAGPGTSVVPADAAYQALLDAASACRRMRTITAEVGVAGTVGGRRAPSGHLIVAVRALPLSARIEALAPFGPVFIFSAHATDSMLLLVRDNRLLEHGPPAAVLEALTGVPLDPAELRTMITGCSPAPGLGAVAADTTQARQLGDDWMTMPEGTGAIYLHRANRTAPWQIAVAVRRDASGAEWHAEYRDFEQDLARSIHLWSSDPGRFDLGLSLSQVEINVTLDEGAFSMRIPRAATPITLEELRDAGPSDGR